MLNGTCGSTALCHVLICPLYTRVRYVFNCVVCGVVQLICCTRCRLDSLDTQRLSTSAGMHLACSLVSCAVALQARRPMFSLARLSCPAPAGAFARLCSQCCLASPQARAAARHTAFEPTWLLQGSLKRWGRVLDSLDSLLTQIACLESALEGVATAEGTLGTNQHLTSLLYWTCADNLGFVEADA